MDNNTTTNNNITNNNNTDATNNNITNNNNTDATNNNIMNNNNASVTNNNTDKRFVNFLNNNNSTKNNDILDSEISTELSRKKSRINDELTLQSSTNNPSIDDSNIDTPVVNDLNICSSRNNCSAIDTPMNCDIAKIDKLNIDNLNTNTPTVNVSNTNTPITNTLNTNTLNTNTSNGDILGGNISNCDILNANISANNVLSSNTTCGNILSNTTSNNITQKYIDEFINHTRVMNSTFDLLKENLQLKKINGELMDARVCSSIVQSDNEKMLQLKIEKYIDNDNCEKNVVVSGYFNSVTSFKDNIFNYESLKSIKDVCVNNNIQVFMIPVFAEYNRGCGGRSWKVEFKPHLKTTVLLKWPYIFHLLDKFMPIKFNVTGKRKNNCAKSKELNELFKHFLFFKPNQCIRSENLHDITVAFNMKHQLTLYDFIQLSEK